MKCLILLLCFLFFRGALSQFRQHQHQHHHHQPQHQQIPETYNKVAGCPSHQTVPSHREVNGNKCYEFILRRPEDWIHAQRDCRSKGGHLVTIENSQEETYIMQYLQKVNYHGRGVWIGLHDINAEGHFSWDSGKPMAFTHWERGQPDDYHYRESQDCVLLYVPQRHDFHMYKDGTPGWHDQRCIDILFAREDDGYICEYDINRPQVHKSTSVVTSVPSTTGRTTQKQMTMAPTTIPTTMPPTSEKQTTTRATKAPIISTETTTLSQQKTTSQVKTTSEMPTPANFIIGK